MGNIRVMRSMVLENRKGRIRGVRVAIRNKLGIMSIKKGGA
jgi:hypothetical protein